MARGLERMDLVIALSEFSREKHREGGVDRPITVLPNFVPDLPTDRVPGGITRVRPYFLFVGRLERIKGLDDVIPLFRDLPDVDLVIAGEGSHGDALRALAAGQANVHFLGRVDHADVGALYRGAVATIAPSMGYEAFARVLIESLQAGVPFVARDIGPAPEVAGTSGAGLLFRTPAELQALLRRLLDDRDFRDGLAAQAGPAVAAHWSESVVVERFLALINATRGAEPGTARAAFSSGA